jgi:hypothetical protein
MNFTNPCLKKRTKMYLNFFISKAKHWSSFYSKEGKQLKKKGKDDLISITKINDEIAIVEKEVV